MYGLLQVSFWILPLALQMLSPRDEQDVILKRLPAIFDTQFPIKGRDQIVLESAVLTRDSTEVAVTIGLKAENDQNMAGNRIPKGRCNRIVGRTRNYPMKLDVGPQ